MQKINAELHLTASDLVGHLNCRYLTMLDRRVADGLATRPVIWDPLLDILSERGKRHEAEYVKRLEGQGLPIVTIDGITVDQFAVDATIAAMAAGAQVIVQGALQYGRWSGRTDILRRKETPSAFGPWSYEVTDTKLARETKGGSVLQLCLYSALVEHAQGQAPEYAYIVTPELAEPEPYRIADYAAYYRHVRASLESSVAAVPSPDTYPEPNPHCDICRWRNHCDSKRRADDHLSLVAGISKAQIYELTARGVSSTTSLATIPLPLTWKPERGAIETYTKVREQARVQVQARTATAPVYELLPVVPAFGLSRLPQPSEGDIFLDFEGDPFVDKGGLEFLFGYAYAKDGPLTYTADWAITRAAEKAAFERFVDFVMKRLETFPDLHIYHFAPYEPAALKRLMGRYATRENEIDHMLRAELFVDLYAVVRHAIRAGVESYSIKKLEPLFGFKRAQALDESGTALIKVQACLELGDIDSILAQDKDIVQAYNREDCLAAAELRQWLEQLRNQQITNGYQIPRPIPKPGEANEEIAEWQRRIAPIIERLTRNVPVDPKDRTTAQHARWILAYILDWHRREQKATWWEHFRLRDLSADDLLDERAAVSGLSFQAVVPAAGRTPVHRYAFLPQDTDIRPDAKLRSAGGQHFGSVVDIDQEARTVDIKKRKDTAEVHPPAVYAHEVIGTDVLAESLFRLAEHVAINGIEGDGPHRAARDLLMMIAPRIGNDELRKPGETAAEAATRLATLLDRAVLPLQGPPGAGKTYTGARMVCALARASMSVGVTANSHKVIRNLLDEVAKAAKETNTPVRSLQRVREKTDNIASIDFTLKNDEVLTKIGGTYPVAGGTAWLWALPEAFEAVDVLFIDEAAQMSLANVLAVSQAAKSLVLLGDPRQLEQPMQGSHPEGTDVSALDHILGEHATIPPDRGLFLEETWRLHPDICTFTSELYYDSRLHSRQGLEHQTIRSTGLLYGTGLRYIPVQHKGNQSSSVEEAEVVKGLVASILSAKSTWVNREGTEAPITINDILIIAPYNAQVFELQRRIPAGRIGTVDKFQGQEAPIVIYSMTTSSHADAPRGMEFLYSANRLNVATSRARCLCILVGSPSVFEAETRTPRQMLLANGFCRYLELAKTLPPPGATMSKSGT
ncbi:TM0106 family RecB-like putative nuclease [Reyranella soli]|uniref:Nuclease n=1 Tax=Reyranella soli TaxID=1230389 RepID=A0A512NCP0_9HYPH|nr:TM0106 family RecB-like putative nuclease [Reyranella soli]GEP56717.1 hypothetical protein RSO01_38830 [Reyranella soli]